MRPSANHCQKQTMSDECESSSKVEKRSLGRRGFLKTAGTIGAALAATPLDVVAAAIANAVYHATGVRVRELPIKIEDLLV